MPVWISLETAGTPPISLIPGTEASIKAPPPAVTVERSTSRWATLDSMIATSSRAAPAKVLSSPCTKAVVATSNAATRALASAVRTVRNGRRARLRTA